MNLHSLLLHSLLLHSLPSACTISALSHYLLLPAAPQLPVKSLSESCICSSLSCTCLLLPAAPQLPAKSLYEYCFDVEEGVWKAWKAYVTPYEPPADNHFSKILVPTVDVVRCVCV